MKIAFFGAGLMGTGFVRGLLARKHQVTVWNRTASKAQALVAEGAQATESPADAVRDAERVFLSLSDDDAVDKVLAAALPALPKHTPIIDLTTTAPGPTRARAARLAAAGVRFLDAPVFMGPENARLAQGLLLCAGPEDLHAALRPELDQMTGKVWYVGAEPGRAAVFKLCGNAMFFAVTAGLSDVFTFARAAGVSASEVLELFQHVNPAKQIEFRGAKMARGDFSATFELSMARKDVRLALETAAGAGDPRLAILPSIAARMDRLIADGHGADDLGVLAVHALKDPAPRRRTFGSTPMLVVSDLARALDFYQRVLGYQDPSSYGDPPCFAMLHRDEHDLMLTLATDGQQVQPHGAFGVWDLHLRVADLTLEAQAILAAGATLAAGPRATEYGMSEIEVVDPDGHRICLGQDLEQRSDDVGR